MKLQQMETKQKETKEEIKQLEKERKDILAGSDTDKNDKAKEKLETKETKIQELKDIETKIKKIFY